jgi:CBS domain containing-hemolysin-like protein
MNTFLALVALLIALGAVVVRKTYYELPARELKRRASRGDKVAAKLYPVVAYGSSLRSLLWLFIGLMSALSIILLARELPVWSSLLIVGPVLWIAFSWLPASRTTKIGARLTLLVTPLTLGLLNYLHPLLSRGAESVEKRTSIRNHTDIYERDDLIALIESQQHQAGNRVSEEELEIARRALSFNDYHVADVLIPRKKVKALLENDAVGPILIDEFHKSGQEYALVRAKAKGPVTGVLEYGRLSIKSTGRVSDLMNPTTYYVHENDILSDALHAFFTTNCPVFIVVNSFEEYTGIVTVESIVRQLLGHIPGDNFDQYADPAAVAARHTKVKAPKVDEEAPVQTGE